MNDIVHRTRDASTSPMRRARAFEPKWQDSAPGAMKRISMLASTAEAVDWGGFREVLSHAPGAVDFSAARALLINHNENLIAGPLSNIRLTADGLEMDADILPGATMGSGVTVEAAIAAGALRGISVGYNYSMKDTSFEESTRTLTVHKWRHLESSLTPIPADDEAALRCRSAAILSVVNHHRANPPKDHAMNYEQWLAARGYDAAKLSDAETTKARAIHGAGGELPKDFAPVAVVVSESTRAQEIAALREEAANAKRENVIRARAAEHGIDIKGIDFAKFKTVEDGLGELLTRKAKADATTPPPVTATSSINYDQQDKVRDAFVGAMAHSANVKSDEFAKLQKDNPLVGRGIQHAIKRSAAMLGCRTENWSKYDIAYFAMGKPEMMSQTAQRDAANVTSGSFPNFVFLNAVTKVVARGYEMGSATARYRRIVETQRVPDFKQFSIGALGTGNLQKTAENIAFPELDKSEGVYNSTVKMWGGTLSLSLQALVNDDTAQFDRILRQAGAIADKTIDRRVFQKLLMGTSAAEATSTWTSNTTSGGSLVYTTADLAVAARGKLALVRAALANKLGLDGNPLGTMPRFLIVPVTREIEAQGIVGPVSPGQIGQNTGQSITYEVIATPWLEASALTGFSTTSYYLLADPNEVTGLVLSYINGLDSIQVQPYDAGAVAGLNWKLWLPFEADLHFMTVGSTATVAAAQQGTT